MKIKAKNGLFLCITKEKVANEIGLPQNLVIQNKENVCSQKGG